MSGLKGGVGGLIGGAVAAVIALVLAVVMAVAMLPALFMDPPPAEASTCVAVAEGAEGKGPRIPNGWGDEVAAAAKVAGVPTEVLAAQIQQESGWNPSAVSPAGAAGLTQFMPGTWAMYGEGSPMDPIASIAAQGKYMKALMDLAKPHSSGADDQVKKALAAYNWGPGNMDAVGWDWSRGPAETQNYIPRILTLAQVSISADCAPALPGAGFDLGKGEWTSPLPGGVMTGAGAFGMRNVPGLPAWAQNHVGIDLATPNGGDVRAPVDLVVTSLYESDGCVMAKATTGPAFGFAFCHMDSFNVADGQKVKRGASLGREGSRAGSIGAAVVRHLHFEMYDPSSPDPQYPGPSAPGIIDPTPILRAKGAL